MHLRIFSMDVVLKFVCKRWLPSPDQSPFPQFIWGIVTWHFSLPLDMIIAWEHESPRRRLVFLVCAGGLGGGQSPSSQFL